MCDNCVNLTKPTKTHTHRSRKNYKITYNNKGVVNVSMNIWIDNNLFVNTSNWSLQRIYLHSWFTCVNFSEPQINIQKTTSIGVQTNCVNGSPLCRSATVTTIPLLRITPPSISVIHRSILVLFVVAMAYKYFYLSIKPKCITYN